MKKILSIIAVLAIICGISAGRVLCDDDITVELDGKEIEFDAEPEIVDGYALIPLRKIFEELGAFVKWDGDTQTVSARKSSKTVTLSINSDEMLIDKGDTDESGNPITETVSLDVPAQIISDRTLVPARAVSEAFGYDVDWDEKDRKITITSKDDEDNTWKENKSTINLTDLTYDGDGIEIDGKEILITSSGDYTLTGTLDNGNITVSAKEKVKLRLNGVSVTSNDTPCIYIEDADKVYITLTDGTKNYLNAENCESGAIYSKDNLEIKGKGSLEISSAMGHGIKASDNLTIESGTIGITALDDGLHINDTFKMSGGSLNITATGDGIDSESIVSITGGNIDIKTNAVPITASAESDTDNNIPQQGMINESTNVQFEKSSKGINAEWLLAVSGGEINVNSASHAIHCADEIRISGGIFNLSSEYEKGISAHGNLTIDDGEIDITKSTEGIESKNIMTINDGVIKIAASDDAINATGGNSGEMMGGPNGGGRPNPTDGGMSERPNRENTENERPTRDDFRGGGRNPADADGQNMDMPPQMPDGGMGDNKNDMKDCLVINGGEFELYAGDDCLDSNGNLIINGGTIKATNPKGSFAGTTAVIDPDGQTKISENANLIFACGMGNERNLSLTQNTIMVYCENGHKANEKISVLDSRGNVIYEYTPNGDYSAVLISSASLKTGEEYTVKIGSESYKTEISEQNTIIGTATSQNKPFNRDFNRQ